MSTESVRIAGVLGSPVAHSLSPVLHSAAFRALGLTGWRYEKIECDAERLPALVSSLGPEWAGLSVTMPGKRAALAVASEATARAEAVGVANTLVSLDSGGWRADCTDVDGVLGALAGACGDPLKLSGTAVILGAGGTALAALGAFAELGMDGVTLVARDPTRAAPAVAVGHRMGLPVDIADWADVHFGQLVTGAAVLVSTVPSAAVAGNANELAGAGCVLDVIYHPWPTPLADAAQRHGTPLATGLDMLLHQAFGQVEQFTGRTAPKEAMRDALRAATGTTLPLPLR